MEHEITMKWINAGQTELPTLLLRYYRQIGLSNDELVLILQIKSYLDKGDSFPSMKKIAHNMKMTEQNIFRAIHQLIQKNVLTIETAQDEKNVTQDAYSLALLWEKIIVLMKQNERAEEKNKNDQSEQSMYQLFEKEFGRPLSPIEIETLVAWTEEDNYSPDLIQLALREAVLSQVYNFKYIDRILLNWDKKNIRTKEQVEKEIKNYREYTSKKQMPESDTDSFTEPVPMINWLRKENENNKS